MTGSEVDYADVQGLVRFGYKRMTVARFDLLRVKNAAAARSWLGSAAVSDAVTMDPPPRTALHVALTAPGLRAIGVSESVIDDFSHEFRTGMATDYRARQLGDVGSNAPEYWQWGSRDSVPHVLVMFLAEPGHLDTLVMSSLGGAWAEAFEVLSSLDTTDLSGREPFGFADGISQPTVDWEQQREAPKTQLDYTNIVALGEVLLGYRNEYKKITDRPLLEPDASSAGLLPALDEPEKKDLARNGTYLVMRQLQQDVRKFWQFIDVKAGHDSAEADKLAAAMVGRTRGGESLVPNRKEAIPGVRGAKQVSLNQFTFDGDASGTQCPFGAHVRRANPRNADFPGRRPGLLKRLIVALGFGTEKFRSDLISSVRFHRILRRGRAYGPELTPADALTAAPPNEPERGLHFICLNANISRQFEFLQGAWIASTKFSGMTGESDPLLGNRQPIPGCPVTSDFNLPQEGGLRRRISGLPQFVTVRGGAYFFLPGLRALQYFAGQGRA